MLCVCVIRNYIEISSSGVADSTDGFRLCILFFVGKNVVGTDNNSNCNNNSDYRYHRYNIQYYRVCETREKKTNRKTRRDGKYSAATRYYWNTRYNFFFNRLISRELVSPHGARTRTDGLQTARMTRASGTVTFAISTV